MKKNKIFLFGGCDLHDIAKDDIITRDFDVIDHSIDRSLIDNTNLDFVYRSFPQVGTSVISLYTKPGPIAQRVLETLSKSRNRDIITNAVVYNEILKFPYLDFYRKHAGPDDYLLIGFSPELYTKYVRNQECFTCLPAMDVLEDTNNCLHWLFKECFTKEDFLLPFDTKESLEWTFDLLVDFARDIYEIFQDRVILVKTHFSNFIISTDFKIKKVSVNHTQLPYYRQTKVVTDPTDHNYAERLSVIIMNKFMHHYSSNLDLIKLNEPVFLDENHKWGKEQFHIDSASKHKIAKLIKENIVTKNFKNSFSSNE